MNFIKCEKLEKSMAELQFSIDAEAFKKAVADVFKKEGKKYAVPGFRKGHVPGKIIDQRIGFGAVAGEAVNNGVPELYSKALEEKGIHPMACLLYTSPSPRD